MGNIGGPLGTGNGLVRQLGSWVSLEPETEFLEATCYVADEGQGSG